MLKSIFISLLNRYTEDEMIPIVQWNKLSTCYTNASRHYHTLQHLENMNAELEEVKSNIKDYDTILLALFYHDIIYNARKSDNEIQSAIYFEQVFTKLSFANIKKCKAMIEATAGHNADNNSDTSLFLDIDLSILGATDKEYKKYQNQIRKEYLMYPDKQYFEGRKKVLEHFLEMKTIFKTAYFQEKFEKQARKNIQTEIDSIS